MATDLSALGAQGISCEVIAGVRHDRPFVPAARLDDATGVLVELQRGGPEASL